MRSGTVELGMPQLSGVGLSETWLLEKCGDLHWAMLAARFGAEPHRLRDRSGQRAYASFIALRVNSRGLDRFYEGDVLQYSSALTQRSRTRFESLHRWRCGSELVEVQMLSVFLRRKRETGNELEEADLSSPAEAPCVTAVSDLEQKFRNERRSACGRPDIVHACAWRPTLALDFNGARLLYFARYHHIVERAESCVFGETLENCYAIERRETYYFANLEPGESITVGFSEVSSGRAHRRHRAELRRASDQKLMARVLTEKRRVRQQSESPPLAVEDGRAS